MMSVKCVIDWNKRNIERVKTQTTIRKNIYTAINSTLSKAVRTRIKSPDLNTIDDVVLTAWLYTMYSLKGLEKKTNLLSKITAI